MEDATERNLLHEQKVRSKMALAGAEGRAYAVHLTASDLRSAFVACQRGDHGEEGNATIDFDEFLVCLALCGHVKYEEVGEMSLAQRVAGICANYLGQKNEQDVTTEAVAPKVERFDPKGATALQGQSAEDHALWVSTWGKMDVSHVYGFPLWEKEIFELLQAPFGELRAIFEHYAGASGDASSMQQTELVDLALDVGLVTEGFPMARVQEVFDRINLIDSRADHDLELH